MRILPVLDLKQGQIVRAVAGHRANYRPVVSRIAPSADPLDVAEGFREHLGLSELYLADLDAILGGMPATDVYRRLQDDGFRLWVDAGIRRAEDAGPLLDAGVERVIAGLETLDSLEVLARLRRERGGEQVVFSLDLMPGSPRDARSLNLIVTDAVSMGIRSLIVLDLTRVGVGKGTGTEELCAELAARYPEVEVLVGGGIRSLEDLQALRRHGVRGALISSAFHDGKIRREHLSLL